MPMIDITKPEAIKFLIESYDRTDKLRMRWNHLFRRKLQQAAEFHTDPKGYFEIDVLKEEMITGMLATTRGHISSKRNKKVKLKTDAEQVLGISEFKKGHSIPEVGLGDSKDDPRLARLDDDFSEDPIMRPVDREQYAIIHKGVPYFGRECYLKVRSKADPEKKYYFPECSSWQYGWRLTDSYFGKQQPMYGRNCLLTRDTMCRSGPQPDPVHYNPPI